MLLFLFNDNYYYYYYSEAEYGESYYEFVLDDVGCKGNEIQLTNCMSGTNPQSCQHGEEASVECSSMSAVQSRT